MEFLLGNPFSTPVGQCLGKAARRTGARVGGGGGDRGLCGSLVPPRGRAGHPCHRASEDPLAGPAHQASAILPGGAGGPPGRGGPLRVPTRRGPALPRTLEVVPAPGGSWERPLRAPPPGSPPPSGPASHTLSLRPCPSSPAPAPLPGPLPRLWPAPGLLMRLPLSQLPEGRGWGAGSGDGLPGGWFPGQGAAAGPRPRERGEAVRLMVRALGAPCDLVQVTALSASAFALPVR